MSRRGAFTLMEVLLATAIGALLVAAALGALSVAVDAFNAVSASGGADAERARFVAAIGADVASAAPLGGVRFSGGRNAMSFARLASQTRSTNGVEVVRVEWGASADGGTVRTLARADGTCVREKFGGVRGMRLRYAGRPAGAEAAAMRELAWVDEWGGKAYPGIVRVEFDDVALDLAPMCSNFALDREGAK